MISGSAAVSMIAREAVRLSWGLLGLGLLLSSGLSAHAQINFVFLSDTQTAPPGALLTYAATVTNTGASTVFLNGDNVTFDGPATLDDTLFASNFVGSLAAGQAITNQPIFTLSVDGNATPGTYLGSFDILGGSTNTASTVLGSQNFELIVEAVPESSTLVLLGLGLGGLAVGRVVRRKAQA